MDELSKSKTKRKNRSRKALIFTVKRFIITSKKMKLSKY